MKKIHFAATAIGFGTWVTIYKGVATYYDDRMLTLFTTYQYRVTVYNDFGHMTSSPSEEVTTFGGVPTKPAQVSASTVNHTSVEVRWITPCKHKNRHIYQNIKI